MNRPKPTTTRDICPSADELGRLLAGDVDQDTRDRLLDHAALCPTCGEEIALVQPLHAWSLESADKLSQSRPAGAKILRPNFQRRVVDRLLPIAAALFLMIGTGLWLQDGRRIDAPSGTLRGGEESRWIVQPADGTRLAEPPQSLELVGGFALPETATYLFEIFDDEDVLLWRSTPQPDPRIKLPSEARLLLPHGDYAWRVLFQDGLERRAGPTARFTVQSQE